MPTRRDLLADSSAVLTTAGGEFGCRTELRYAGQSSDALPLTHTQRTFL